MVTQRDIARHLGLHQSTVSLALRHSALIPQQTRLRVAEAARELGYRPNPLVATLMEHVRSARPVREGSTLGIVVDFPDAATWLAFHEAYRLQYQGIVRRAQALGYRCECFFLRSPGMTAARLDQILYARGISGLILIGPRQSDGPPLVLRWERYAVVKCGYAWRELPFDGVNADNRQQVELAFAELERLGCRRVGYCLSRRMVPRANLNWLAGHHLSARRLPPSRRIPLFVSEPSAAGEARFRRWIARWQPDAIVGGRIEMERLARWPEFRGVFCSRYHYEGGAGPAIAENSGVIGETLCELLIGRLLHNQRGVQPHPRSVQIAGTWVPPPPANGG